MPIPVPLVFYRSVQRHPTLVGVAILICGNFELEKPARSGGWEFYLLCYIIAAHSFAERFRTGSNINTWYLVVHFFFTACCCNSCSIDAFIFFWPQTGIYQVYYYFMYWMLCIYVLFSSPYPSLDIQHTPHPRSLLHAQAVPVAILYYPLRTKRDTSYKKSAVGLWPQHHDADI